MDWSIAGIGRLLKSEGRQMLGHGGTFQNVAKGLDFILSAILSAMERF